MKLCRVCDLDAIRENLKTIRKRAEADLLFMVKCNAYGHGMDEVARATEDLVSYFGVATVDEALRLRTCEIKKAILASVFLPSDADEAVEGDISCAIYNLEQLRAVECAAKRIGKKAKVHIKIDSGMSRLGISYVSEVNAMTRALLARQQSVVVEGIYSHLRSVNYEQIERFEILSRPIKENFKDAICHIAATSAIGAGIGCEYEMVRVGIGGYGYGINGVTPALTVMTEVITARQAKSGEYVGYGSFRLDKDTNIAVLLGGYGDGVLRRTGHVLFRGEKRSIISAPCMDMVIIDTGETIAKPGEVAYYLAPGLDAEDIASETGTIVYETLTSFDRSRSEMYYFK